MGVEGVERQFFSQMEETDSWIDLPNGKWAFCAWALHRHVTLVETVTFPNSPMGWAACCRRAGEEGVFEGMGITLGTRQDKQNKKAFQWWTG